MHQACFVTAVTIWTTESATTRPIANHAAHTFRTWQIQRLGQLPLDLDDPAPARIEAFITRLNKKVKNMPGDAKVAVLREEDKVLRDILR